MPSRHQQLGELSFQAEQANRHAIGYAADLLNTELLLPWKQTDVEGTSRSDSKRISP